MWKLLHVVLAPVLGIASTSAKQSALFLGSCALLSLLVYVRQARRPRIRGALRYCFPVRLFRHPSSVSDLKVMLLNTLLLLPLAPAVTATAMASYGGIQHGLKMLAGADALGLPITTGSMLVATLVNVLAIELTLFLTHYAQHKVPLLWEFHKTHHSAKVLTPFTVFRMHPVDLFVIAIVNAALIGATSSAFVFLFGTNPVLSILGNNVFVFAFYLFGYNLRHSHVWLMYPGWLGRHISGPALHIIHHSIDPRHRDKNLAQIFTFWDRMAGTLYLPAGKEAIEIGIGNGEEVEFRTLPALYFLPFKKSWSRFVARRPVVSSTPAQP
ncbi:MAG: sterol desaturase family protein [Stellaceae bacterium]